MLSHILIFFAVIFFIIPPPFFSSPLPMYLLSSCHWYTVEIAVWLPVQWFYHILKWSLYQSGFSRGTEPIIQREICFNELPHMIVSADKSKIHIFIGQAGNSAEVAIADLKHNSLFSRKSLFLFLRPSNSTHIIKSNFCYLKSTDCRY